jgi:hypothetical protein
MLEERVARLVAPDGSFSQYSVNYHRLLLDTLSLAEWWRRALGEAPFGKRFYERAAAATTWLHAMTDERCGDAPDVGGNDGARLMPVSAAPFRDFRPSVQLAAALFLDSRAYDDPLAEEPLRWLGIATPQAVVPPRTSRDYPHGGWVTLHAGGAGWACLRYPAHRFRPSHADALHLDLWHDGVNVLRDAGSFGYAAGEPWASYFPGTAAHNTVEFDGRDQMPRAGRFLFAEWPRAFGVTDVVERPGDVEWSGGYEDALGCRHVRTVSGRDRVWTVEDRIAGPYRSAMLRWRLAPGMYVRNGATFEGAGVRVTVSGVEAERVRLAEGWESRHYRERTPLPVLEVELPAGEAAVTTEIRLGGDGE